MVIDRTPSPPNYTTKEKGKRRLVEPSPQDGADGYFSTLPIPYGSPSIITSPQLNEVNCVVYLPLRLLICVICCVAVQPSSLPRHRRGAGHRDPTVSKKMVDSIVKDHNLFGGDVIRDPPDPFIAVPGIPFMPGLRCSYLNCRHGRRGGRKKIGEHVAVVHGSSIKYFEPIPCKVQVIFESNATNYPVVLPEIPEVPATQPDLGQMVMSMYHDITSNISSVSNDSAHLSPFLTVYKWDELVHDTLPSDIAMWISPPSPEEEDLVGLVEGVKEYYWNATKEMNNGDAWTTVLRYINSTKM